MIIVKFAQNNKGIIGNNNTIPWHCSQDLKDFKKETFGHAIVMGRKTFESIGSRPLYGRLNIVLSMNDGWIEQQKKHFSDTANIVFISDLSEIMNAYSTLNIVFGLDNKNVYIIGGAFLIESCIRQYHDMIDEVQISLINDNTDGDTVVNPALIELCKNVKVTNYELEKE